MRIKSLTSTTRKRVSVSFVFLFSQTLRNCADRSIIRFHTKLAMYPKVKVVDEIGNCKQSGSCLINSNYLQSRVSESNNQDEDFQTYVAKIPKIYIPSVLISDIESKEINKHSRGTDIKAVHKDKASPVLRPRAVVSSPDNDAMIGSINRSEERKAKTKGLKSNGHISSRASQRKNIDTNVKISHRTVAKQSGVNTRERK